uniref:Uncharacterized protein n=1 Tax=Arion vulgaris TaxID=1028688 RepID=A0A0B7AWG7_9EUPU
MGALSGIYILLMVFIIGGHSFSPRIFNPFPLGTIGCLDSDVCESGYICTDDFAFGTCQNIFSSSINGKNTFQLSRNDISALEDEIARLSNAGFTWKDALTQCTLQNMLIELREGRMFKRYFCEEALNQEPQSFTEDTDSPNGRVFVKLLEPGDIPLDNILVQASDTESDADLFNNNKRDEIIQIHKYFDESRGQHKRDPYLVDAASVYQNADLSRHRLHRPRNIFLEQVKENDNNPFINNNEDRYEVSNPNPLTSVFLNSAQIPSLNKNKYNRLQNSIEEQDNKGEHVING